MVIVATVEVGARLKWKVLTRGKMLKSGKNVVVGGDCVVTDGGSWS